MVLCCPLQAKACGLALLFALDVSLSVDEREFQLQTSGLATALRDDNVQKAITSIDGGVALALMQWSGRNEQHMYPSWRKINSAAELDSFARSVEVSPRRFSSKTAPGSALGEALAVHFEQPFDCSRTITNVSGDGIANDGADVRKQRSAHIQHGYTINGLIILGADDRLEGFYRHNVIGGPGNFLETAQGFEDYGRAMKEKLLKELPQDVASVRP